MNGFVQLSFAMSGALSGSDHRIAAGAKSSPRLLPMTSLGH
jgi:hypothetical protein